jgi:K+-sensing histidine kinase KdpD
MFPANWPIIWYKTFSSGVQVAGAATSLEQQAESSRPADNQVQSSLDGYLEMFALFVHDLESPLASMKYVLRMLEQGRLDLKNPRHRQLVSSSHIAVARAEAILYDSIAVAKSGAMGMKANLVSVDLNTVLGEAATLAEGAAAEMGISISVALPAKGMTVQADPLLLARALDNLIFNGIRHTPEKGTVHIGYTEENGMAVIQIRDSGAGLGDINPEELFDKYGQINLRLQGKHRGVGLGLYFCRLASEAMNGKVSASNHADGGALFSIYLHKSGGIKS